MGNIDLTITGEQLIYIIIMTGIIGYVIKRIVAYAEKIDVVNIHNEISMILEKCYALFPIENISFKGEVFKRGMKIKITTSDKKDFEGEFIGANSSNVICILTSRCIITREITHITDIKHLAKTDNIMS